MKCLNIADKNIKKLADEFGEVAVSLAIDKWEALGHKDLPTADHMRHLEQLVVDVDNGKNAEEAHETLRKSLRSEPSLSTAEKRTLDVGIDRTIEEYKKDVEKIEGDNSTSQESKNEDLNKLSENFVKDHAKMLIGDGETKADAFKEKLRETYTGIKGFDNDFDTEKMLVDIAHDGTFEKDFDKSIDNLYEEGLKEDNIRKINLAKRLGDLKEGELVSMFTFFHSSQNIPYLKFLWDKANKLKIEFSNSGFEQSLIKKVTEKLDSLSEAEYTKLYNAQRIKPVRFQTDAEYLEKLTGIPVDQWKKFVENPSFDKKYYESILRNFVVFRNHESSTKKNLLSILTKAKGAKKGSVINTIALNTPFQDRAKEILPRFKNTVWNLKSSNELDSHLLNRIDELGKSISKKEQKIIGKLPMQSDNIEKIKLGKKTLTNRTSEISNGIYELPDGTKIELSFEGMAKVYSDGVKVGINSEFHDHYHLDDFAIEEGFNDWEDFKKNNKFSSNFINGKQIRYIYSINIISDKSDYYKGNKWVQMWSKEKPQQANIDGFYSGKTEKNQEAGKLSDEDLRKTMVESYKSNVLNNGNYFQVTGQYGDKDKLHVIEAKKFTDTKELEKEYTALLVKQGATESQAAQVIRTVKKDSVSYNPYFSTTEAAELFALNHAYNFNMINDYINGDVAQYGKKDKAGNWKTSPVIELFKRNGSTASPGMFGNKYVKDGLGKGFKYAVINTPIIDGIKGLDGQSFITRAHSNKVNKSFGTIFDFNTSIKAITSFVNPQGKRFLDKTNSIVIDDLAKEFPDSIYAKILAFMNKNGIDKVSTVDGAKFHGEIPVIDFFKKGTSEALSLEDDYTNHMIDIKTEDYLVQQDLVNDGEMYEASTPIQRTKNMIHDQAAEKIAKLFNEVGQQKLKDISDKIQTTDKETWRKYILAKIGFSQEEIDNLLDEELSKEELADLDSIEQLLASGVSFSHPHINGWLSRYIANVITKQALGRVTNKVLAVEGAYLESKDFKLGDYTEKDGKITLPQSAVPFNSGLRGPKTVRSKKEAISTIMSNKARYQDMFIGFDENGNTLGIHEHEIEILPDGSAIIPGEAHLITRIPADNMHSHTLARVKYILPEGLKNIVITNHETQVIAGSDFDGDQRTIEGFFKDKNDNVKMDGNSKHALANKALHLQMQWYYNSENRKTAIEPIDTEHYDKYLKELPKEDQRTKDSPETFVDARKKNNVGLAVVGIMANLQSVYDFLRKHNSFIKSFTDTKSQQERQWIKFPTIFLKDGKLSLRGHKVMKQFINSNHIKNAIGNLLNLSLDNVKDPKIERLGLNEVTVKMFVPALMTGMSEESVIAFFNTPTVKRFVSMVRATATVDNEGDINKVFSELAEEFGEEFINTRNDAELTQADLEAKTSFNILRKLRILSGMGYDYDRLNSVIKLTEQAPKSWTDFRIATNNFTDVQNNWLNYIDTSEFEDSPFITAAENALEISGQYFQRFGNEQTDIASRVMEAIEENLQVPEDKTRVTFNREQLTSFSKAVNSMMTMMSRGRSDRFKKWKGQVIERVTKLKEQKKYSAITSALEIQDDKISIREDLKRNPLDIREEREIKAEFDRLAKSENAEDQQFLKDLVDYAVFHYELSPSTARGSYSALFSPEVHKQIGEEVEEVYNQWKEGGFSEEWTSRIANSVYKANPIFITRRGKDNGKRIQRIYEPFATDTYTIATKDKATFEKIATGDKLTLNVATNGENSDFAKNAEIDDIVTISHGDQNITVSVAEINPDPNVTEVTFKKVSQKQKTSVSNENYNEKVIDRLKKAFPSVNVIIDDKLNTAGELDADGQTVRINPNYAGLDTPIHEFGHIFIDALGGTKSDFVRKGIDQLRNTDLWKEVKKKYPELSQDMFEKEVLAEAIGREGVAIFKNTDKRSAFRKWLDMLFFRLKLRLGLERNIAKQMARELLSGRKVNLKMKSVGVKQFQKAKPADIAKALKSIRDKIQFNEEKHEYSFNDRILTPTTTKIDNIEEYRYTGNNSDEHDVNSKVGRSIHKVLEDIVNGKTKEEISKEQDFTSDTEVFDKIHTQLEKLVSRIKKDGTVLSEVMIGNLNNSVAGTVDVLVIRDDGSVDIYDLKTSIRSTEDKELYRNRYNGVKASKEDKHGLQMATYAKMLELGDEELGIPKMKINNLTIIPIHLTLEGSKVKDASPEENIGFGYSNYNDQTLQTLPEQPVFEEKKILDAQEDKFYKTRHNTRQAYAEAKYENYNYIKAQKELEDLRHKMDEVQGSTTMDSKERSALIKEIQAKIDKIVVRGQKLQKEYDQYLEDFDAIVNFYKNTNVEDITDLNELLKIYNQFSKMNSEASKQLMDDTKIAIAKKMMDMRTAALLEKNPTLNPGTFSKEDLKVSDVWMKALSDFTEAHPEMQEFADQYFRTYNKMLEEKQTMIKEMEDSAKEVIADYHKKEGIAGKVKNYFNPFANNQRYFAFMEKGGKMLTSSDAEYKSLTKAQQSLITVVSKYRSLYEDQMNQGKTKFNRKDLVKVDRTFSETLEKDGLYSALVKYVGAKNYKQKAVLLYDENKKLRSFEDIEEELLQKVADKKLSKISALLQIRKYQKRAETAINKKRHEDGSEYNTNDHSEYEINANGEIKSKFHNKASKDLKYSKDFYRASLEMFSEMNFIKHMQPMLPLVESLEAYNKSLGDDRKNMSKYIDIWKRGNILKEELSSGGRKIDNWIRFFRKLTHLRVMAFNIPSAIFNVIIGKYNQFRGDSVKNLGKGEKRFWTEFKKSQAILKQYQATSVESETNPAHHVGQFFNLLMYGATQLGERWIQGGGVIGQITDEEWSWLDDDGSINIESAKDNAEIKQRQETLIRKMNEYKKKVRDIQGKYSDEDKRNFSHFELGRAAMQFKVWMPDALRDRFAGKYIDLNGNERQGTINRLFYNGIEDLKAVMNDPKLFTSNEPEWKLHRRNLRSLMAMGSAMGLFFMAAGGDDDDKWWATQLSKTMNDMATGFSFDNAEFTLKNPIAMLGTASKAVETIESAFMYQTYKNNGNKYGDKGDWKTPGMVLDMLPYKNVPKLIAEAVDNEE